MIKYNIEDELNSLRINFINQTKLFLKSSTNLNYNSTFRKENWLITFPFNFCNQPNELIRKLAVINSLYITFFLREDDVIDEYQVSKKKYSQLITNMLEAHSYRNLAIGQLLNLSNTEIFKYIFEYEKKYYESLIFEKKMTNIASCNMFEYCNLIKLGQKLIPLCVTFAAYCLIKKESNKISICEELIINYHIAKQLYDDIKDYKEDIKKIDLSYLIKACIENDKKKELTKENIKIMLISKDIIPRLTDTIILYLSKAEQKAKELNFNFFLIEIQLLKRSVENYSIKYFINKK